MAGLFFCGGLLKSHKKLYQNGSQGTDLFRKASAKRPFGGTGKASWATAAPMAARHRRGATVGEGMDDLLGLEVLNMFISMVISGTDLLEVPTVYKVHFRILKLPLIIISNLQKNN